ncbi:MAG: endonuclease/exonuclease/phosphatase family protein [Cyclobacteriaceae bacterium]
MPLFKIDHWVVRGFDFPFVQFTVLGFAILAGWFVFWEPRSLFESITLVLLAIAVLFRCWIIFPYLRLAKIKVLGTTESKEEDMLSIISANVLMYNENHQGLINIIQEKNPDLVLLLEADHKWKEGVEVFMDKHYPYTMLFPESNTYGLLLYSKLKLENEELRFLVEENVPSIKTVIHLKNNERVVFYGLHPKPPSPSENEKSTPRDAELVLVGRECREGALPVIVAGDMNDVAWSHTTRLFLRISGLLDPRMGRGFFSTYHAKYPLVRWPLDHVFVSHHFKVKRMQLLSNFGSDHFPIYVELVFAPSEIARQNIEAPDLADRVEANKKLEDAEVD